MMVLSLAGALKIVFWASFFIIFYSYVGYGLLLFVLVSIKRMFRKQKTFQAAGALPAAALVVAAYNEEDYIEEKIQNTLELDYPKELLEIVFITDGSTDKTDEIISRYPAIRLLHQPERRGKVAAMNRAMQYVQSPLVIFCDANTLLNKECVKEIVKHYDDPKVGGVAGEKKIIQHGNDTAAAVGEGLYWRYESFLKRLDSEFYTAVGAAGELFSVRKDLFEKAPEGTIIEDFVQSLRLCVKGYVLRYEPRAYAAETASASVSEEMKRKVRICAGAFQAMILLKDLFNVFKYPKVSFQFISHRILRWTICPAALVILFLTDLFLLLANGGMFYDIIFIVQVAFYAMATVGWIYANRDVRIKVLYIPFYFTFMNISVFMGFNRFIRKKQTVLWEKAVRQRVAL